MGFLKNVISGFHNAVKAGNEFNPTLVEVTSKIEELHANNHLDDVLFEAEQTFKVEHEGYLAKGIHTNAADSQNDSAALKHFMEALKNAEGTIEDPALKEEGQKLIDLRDQMEHILSGAFKK